MDTSELLERQLHFVCGKGGVGKSVVSCALALHFRERGHRVLLAQIASPADAHAYHLETRPTEDDLVEQEPDLWTVNTDPEQSLKEYALMTLKFETLYKAAFENRVMKLFLRFVPSIAEVNMLGKLWFHSEERDGNRPRFDRVIVDCPSTGHGIGFLRVSQVLTDVMRGAGPAAKKTIEMSQTFEDPKRTALHVVTLAEEMPVNETVEFVAQVEATRVAPLGAVFVNQVRTPLTTGLAVDADFGEATRFVDERRQREHLEREQIARLEAAFPDTPRVILPRLQEDPFRRAAIEALAASAFGDRP